MNGPAPILPAGPFAIQYFGWRWKFKREQRDLLGMSDRGLLFLFSIFMIVVSLGAAVYLFATGQGLTIDGLFMVLVALLTALVFALYIMFVIRRAMEAAKPPAKTVTQA